MRKHAVLQESNKASGSEVPPALELKSITAGYGKSVVLHDVDITVSAGSVVALIGSNGAGKTTLLRTAAGLLRPRSGRVHMSGHDCTERKPWERSRGGLCLVPEGRGVFRRLTVSDNLRLQVSPSSKDSSVERALDAFPALRYRLHVPAGKLSGGEQQMLALARAYLSNPSVLLLDEVSMGLAPLMVDSIFESLADLASQGIALLLVEQYVKRALEMADYAYLINRGTITFAGPRSELDADEVLQGYLGG